MQNTNNECSRHFSHCTRIYMKHTESECSRNISTNTKSYKQHTKSERVRNFSFLQNFTSSIQNWIWNTCFTFYKVLHVAYKNWMERQMSICAFFSCSKQNLTAKDIFQFLQKFTCSIESLKAAHLFHFLQNNTCCIQKLNAEKNVKLCVFYRQQTNCGSRGHISSLTKICMQHKTSESSRHN